MDERGGPPPLLSSLEHLDLHALLAEVVERVEGVAALGDRLQALLEAVVSLSSDLDLERVLNRVVQTAADLAGARYAAIGVLDPSGERRLSQFVTAGVDEATVARMGHPPEGRGVLGLLIDDPRPLRLTDLSAHPASVGLPGGHPPMRSFLGVPITIRGEVFGHLYLTEKRDGAAFTAIDEQVLQALAAAAGQAVWSLPTRN